MTSMTPSGLLRLASMQAELGSLISQIQKELDVASGETNPHLLEYQKTLRHVIQPLAKASVALHLATAGLGRAPAEVDSSAAAIAPPAPFAPPAAIAPPKPVAPPTPFAPPAALAPPAPFAPPAAIAPPAPVAPPSAAAMCSYGGSISAAIGHVTDGQVTNGHVTNGHVALGRGGDADGEDVSAGGEKANGGVVATSGGATPPISAEI